jgi:hypothetical protein
MPTNKERADVMNQPIVSAAELAFRQIQAAVGLTTSPLGEPENQRRMTIKEIQELAKGN